MDEDQDAVSTLSKLIVQILEEDITFEPMDAFEDNVLLRILTELKAKQAGAFQFSFLMSIWNGYLTITHLDGAAVLATIRWTGLGECALQLSVWGDHRHAQRAQQDDPGHAQRCLGGCAPSKRSDNEDDQSRG